MHVSLEVNGSEVNFFCDEILARGSHVIAIRHDKQIYESFNVNSIKVDRQKGNGYAE